MKATASAMSGTSIPVSPLMLADRLLTLAQDADRAGYTGAASHLVTAMYKVLDSSKPARH
jgi:hypothetical protein